MKSAEHILERAGWGGAQIQPIASDASDRSYIRLLRGNGETAILMRAPVGASETARAQFDAFRRVSAWLHESGIAVPLEYSVDTSAGLILMEDLGRVPLSHLVEFGSPEAEPAYRSALDVLVHLAKRSPPEWLSRPTPDDMAAMIDLTFSMLPGSEALATQVKGALSDQLTKVQTLPATSLRDVHGDNLIWRREKMGLARIGVLDFQDAVILPLGYDLASLLDDPRRDVPEAWRTTFISGFALALGQSGTEMSARVDLLSLQRNLRVLGIFRRLATERGRPDYARFLPRTRALIHRAVGHEDFRSLRPLVTDLLDRTAHWDAVVA